MKITNVGNDMDTQYKTWQEKQKRIASEKKFSKEIEDTKIQSEALKSFIILPEKLFDRSIENNKSIPITHTECGQKISGTESIQSIKRNSNIKSTQLKKMSKARKQIMKIMEGCKSIEKGTNESAKLLSKHAANISNHMNYTETITQFVSRDV